MQQGRFPSSVEGFLLCISLFFPPNHKISWQGSSRFACFFQAWWSLSATYALVYVMHLEKCANLDALQKQTKSKLGLWQRLYPTLSNEGNMVITFHLITSFHVCYLWSALLPLEWFWCPLLWSEPYYFCMSKLHELVLSNHNSKILVICFATDVSTVIMQPISPCQRLGLGFVHGLYWAVRVKCKILVLQVL